ncbi:MAG TPA: hypothetical protein VJ249_00295 [Candidatus Bathyarchaeia archaeon]|nr:hypothetical protein [Candidatus Bathyarchaeia archaeon]
MKKMSIALVLMAVLPISLLVAGVHASVGWSRWYTAPIDSDGFVGRDTSIALDSSGSPHIRYFNWTSGDLKYATWTDAGPGWSIETVDSGSEDVGGSGGRSIDLDSGGNPHISYIGPSYQGLKYATKSGGTWSIDTVDSAGEGWPSLALDSSNNPHISYYNSTEGLKYARWTGSAWNIEVADSTNGRYTSIALDSSDNPHISYRGDGNAVMHARKSGGTWNIETVDSTPDGTAGTGTSIALDSGNNPHISYQGWPGLRYAEKSGSSWINETVDSYGDFGAWNSIAIDSSDNPNIAYRDDSNGRLRYAMWTGSAWNLETVDEVGNVGSGASIALDSNNNPHISYYDGTNSDLKYASILLPDEIWSSDASGNPKDVFVPGETVYVTCPQPRTYWTTVTIYVVADQAVWNEGDSLTDVSGGDEMVTVSPGPTGTTQTFQIWPPLLAVGSYDIVMDKDNDAVFDQGLDLVDSVLITGFNVIPEVPFGTAMTFLSMFIAFVGFLGFKRLRPKIQLQFRKTD